MSEYTLEITRAGSAKVPLKPGSQREKDFVQDIVAAFLDKFPTDRIIDALAEKGVGVFKTQAQVQAAARDVLATVARPHLEQAIYDAVRDVFRKAKNEVVP